MLLRTPIFYRNFHCLAGKCTDTCCIGWEIDVDEKTLERYRRYDKDCGQEPQQKKEPLEICSQIEDGHFKLTANDGCPFLRKDGLCRIICKYGVNGTDRDKNGESVLGDICREHPRFVEVYGDIMEKGVGLCCEEAVRLLLDCPFPACHPEALSSVFHPEASSPECHPEERSDEESNNPSVLTLVESEIDDIPDEMPKGAAEARDAIFAERKEIFRILSDENRPLNQRLIDILDFAVPECHPEQSEGSSIPAAWLTLLAQGENYGSVWNEALARIQLVSNRICHSRRLSSLDGDDRESPIFFTDRDGARIVAYLIFRYYAKSLFDGDSIGKVKFAIFFWLILKNFAAELAGETTDTFTAKINAVKLLSKQTEYSDEVMNILYTAFDEFQDGKDAKNDAFSIASFKRILQL